MKYLSPDIIGSNHLFMLPNAPLFVFGILTSNVHMAWMRTIGGRRKSDYNYSNQVIYNTFPWPNLTDKDKSEITKTAQGILDARSHHENCTLADLYDPSFMPDDLKIAHQKNDKAVMKAYGFWGKFTSKNKEENEIACATELMMMYKKLLEKDKHK